LIIQIKGNPTKERYNAATVFVDHYSDITFVHLQRSLSAEDTIEAKEAFERWSKSHSVTISHCHADNGRFAETAFMAHVAKCGQTITFCGVNAHFQNGQAERRIRTLQELGRTQLLHAMARWPVAISHHLWPYVICNVSNCLNDMARTDEEKTRMELFAGTEVAPNVKQHHHIGCPVYVLENDLQSGKKMPKWMARARVGIYLGMSLRHARSVSLVLNPRTGMTSPQYHIKVDDTFETVLGITEATHGTWRSKCGFTKEITRKVAKTTSIKPRITKSILKVKETNDDNRPSVDVEQELLPDDFGPLPEIMENERGTSLGETIGDDTGTSQEPTLRRSKRNWKPTPRMLESIQQREDEVEERLPISLQAACYDDQFMTMIDDENPMCLLARTDGDTMYWDQALKQHDASNFIQAAIDEVTTHQDNKHWKVIARSEVPDDMPVLDAVWSMKRMRRLLTNEIYKWKARLNLHGGQQDHGVNYWEIYTPVVAWAAIRLMLALVLMYEWKTVQIDFVLAYPQADVECDIYMQIPKGFELEGKTRDTHVLKLIKNLYGQKQAGHVWNKHLHDNLIDMGWKQSKADDCLYYKGRVMFVVYVDDGILISKHQEDIDKELTTMRKRFNISIEGTLSDYVGVNIQRTDDGEIHMTQPNIIRSILQELNFNKDTKSMKTPALSSTILKDGKQLEQHKADWSYRRLIGKLNFLSSSCRPELSCAIHQAARFSADPRTNHTEAVKRC
jgi:Reverse transcriptase (RNA-dependent DNA polymerase)